MRMRVAALLLAAIALPCPVYAAQTASEVQCAEGQCTYRLTPEQLLAQAERLVQERRFDEARVLADALGKAPGFELQHRFLTGFIAVETGNPEEAIRQFRAILADDPTQTRVRLELARALLMTGKEAAADHHFRLAENDGGLPEDIARTIRNARGLIRSQRRWNVTLDLGIAPDTNINGATDAETIDFRLGPYIIPLKLDDEARRQSGIGQIAAFSGEARVPMGDRISLIVDGYGQATNYRGDDFDDFSAQIAVGPEFRLDTMTSISVQALGQQRWYGGDVASRQIGAKAAFQKVLNQGQRVGLQFDVRRNFSGFSDDYDGWQLAGYATLERVVRRSFIASATGYVRRDLLTLESYSSTDYGVEIGVGGELPMGINAGLSGGVGRAEYDAPIGGFSTDVRKDWRLNARAYAGLRSVRLMGFSPSITYTFGRTDTNYALYQMNRHKMRFNLARYF
ncbi:surface lipoprotein assembly modifier [Allosphingosinicella vermicomposti]|uniref:surface lipoprotein assembly modifier n=1 Tax=Allosphingosinicella vermicomposti TaxID=614671 RepID=UPI00131A546A|nr:surface lipoprotein assembly modifier [Allosphingosinicella vermicomposti]